MIHFNRAPKISFATVLFFLFFFNAFAQKDIEVKSTARGDTYIYYYKKSDPYQYGPYGLNKTNGSQVLPPIFSILQYINEKYVLTGVGGYYTNIYRIDSDFLFPHNLFQELMVLDADHFIFKKEGYYGVMDMAGNIILDNKYEYYYSLNAFVVLTETGYKKLFSLKENKIVMEGQFTSITRFNDSLFTGITSLGTNIYTRQGRQVLNRSFEKIESYDQNRFIVTADHKQGLCDLSGKVHIPIEYFNLFRWNNYFISRKKTLWGIIDDKGNEIVPFKYESLSRTDWDWNVQIGSSNGKFELFTPYHLSNDPSLIFDNFSEFGNRIIAEQSGEFYLIEFNHHDVINFSQGYESINWLVGTDVNEGSSENNRYTLVKKGGKYGVLKSVSDLIISTTYDTVKFIGQDNFLATSGNHSYLIHANNLSVKREFNLVNIFSCYKNYFVVMDKGKAGIYDFNANSFVIPASFNTILTKNGKFYCITDDSYKVYDITTNGLVENKSKPDLKSLEADYYKDSCIIYQKKGDYENRYALVNRNTNEFILPPVFHDMKFITSNLLIAGILYKNQAVYRLGKGFIVPFNKYDYIRDLGNGVLQVELNRKTGIIDYDGNILLPLIYDHMEGISDPKKDLLRITYKNREGLFSLLAKKIIITPQYHQFSRPVADNLLVVKCDSGYQLINIKNEKLYSGYYDELFAFSSNYILARKNDLYGVLDKNEVAKLNFVFKNINVGSYFWGLVISRDSLNQFRVYNKDFAPLLEGSYDNIEVLDYGKGFKTSHGTDYCFYRAENGVLGSGSMCNLQEVRDLEDGLSISRQRGFFGVINKDYEIVLPFRYQDINRMKISGKSQPPHFLINENNKKGIATAEGNIIIPTYYNFISYNPEGNYFIGNIANKSFLITIDGLVADSMDYGNVRQVYPGTFIVYNKENKCGIYKSTLKKEVIPCEYQFMVPINDYLYYGYKDRHFSKISIGK